ncbi:unnamed protein product [Spirodela intermedia]|uniref:CBF1-interacting co-repressor CIR N-terminal domain-containing protein n=1 Tax=Spirodela intermedia TaxID=51605 RepID=A0A7I8LF46_SPIIN|nr:unnamed protein product [Spirodela intermedia]
MALKFLNKKGWHTGSLRNIENVWKAEQKHEAEQRKLEELRKQIQEERERAEFRLLQERAGLAPRQERLEFLYESGLAVGKGSSEGFKTLQAPAKAEASSAATAEPSTSKAATPGALFEESKPQSANDAWRKLHSDPLLLIRQREQEAIARIKNNPVQMAMIKKSVEAEKKQKEKGDKKEKKTKKKKEHKRHHHGKSKHGKHSAESSDSEDSGRSNDERNGDRSRSKHRRSGTDREDDRRRDRAAAVVVSDHRHATRRHDEQERAHPSSERRRACPDGSGVGGGERPHKSPERDLDGDGGRRSRPRETNQSSTGRHGSRQSLPPPPPRRAPRLTEEERVARLREMQMDAELHEEQRWKRIKKASETDAKEAAQEGNTGGKNFLDATRKSMFGTEKGGSATIEESVRRRTYYLQGGAAAHEGNAFRRH